MFRVERILVGNLDLVAEIFLIPWHPVLVDAVHPVMLHCRKDVNVTRTEVGGGGCPLLRTTALNEPDVSCISPSADFDGSSSSV